MFRSSAGNFPPKALREFGAGEEWIASEVACSLDLASMRGGEIGSRFASE
jgi:hypothetical protein